MPRAPTPTLFPYTTLFRSETRFVDKGVENDRTYYYGVRAIRDEAGTVARGVPSPRVAATPGRTTPPAPPANLRSEEHTSELQSLRHLVCRLLLEKKNKNTT